EYPLRRDLLAQLSSFFSGDESSIYISGEPFPGWEFLVPLINPLSHNILDLCPNAVLFLDEPQEVRQEVERLWMILEPEFEQAGKEGRPAAPPDRLYLRWEQMAKRWASHPQLNAQEFDLTSPPAPTSAHFHLSTRPAPRFHGNIPLALAEMNNLLRD